MSPVKSICLFLRYGEPATQVYHFSNKSWFCSQNHLSLWKNAKSNQIKSFQNLCCISCTNFCEIKRILKVPWAFSTECIDFNWHTGNWQFIPIKYFLTYWIHKLIIALSCIVFCLLSVLQSLVYSWGSVPSRMHLILYTLLFIFLFLFLGLFQDGFSASFVFER